MEDENNEEMWLKVISWQENKDYDEIVKDYISAVVAEVLLDEVYDSFTDSKKEELALQAEDLCYRCLDEFEPERTQNIDAYLESITKRFLEEHTSKKTRKKRKGKASAHYVNNKELYEELKVWLGSGDTEVIPDSIGFSILKIAQGLAEASNFNGYTWKDEFIGDGVVACIKYIRNFNPEKTNNPFGYFSQICYNAFIKRIKQENLKISQIQDFKEQLYSCYDTIDGQEYSYISNKAQMSEISKVTYGKHKTTKYKTKRKTNSVDITEF